jgi:hypothetical protein
MMARKIHVCIENWEFHLATPPKCQKLSSLIPKTVHVKFRATPGSLSTTLWWYYKGQNWVVVVIRCLYLIQITTYLMSHTKRCFKCNKGEFPCRSLAHWILENSGLGVFTSSWAQSCRPTTFWQFVRTWIHVVMDTCRWISMRLLKNL